MEDKEERETHESYVQVAFSRRQGNPGRLYGSPLKSHESYVTLSVRKSERIHDLGSDRFYGSIRGDVVEVDMSAAQFAEVLTTMNIGMGVPGTLRYLNGKKVADPPDVELEVEKVKTGFKKKMLDLSKFAEKSEKDVRAILDKKGALTKSDKETILRAIRTVSMEIGANAPFIWEQFQEATEKVVSHAKAEVDAFITTNIVESGLRAAFGAPKPALEGFDQPPVPALPPGNTEDNS